MNNAYWKDILSSIRKGKKRFISIALIVTLGVTMLTGISAACTDLRYSADQFFDRQELFDIEIISTLGLEEADVEALSSVEGVELAEGGYTEEVYTQAGDARKTASMEIIHDSGINMPYLTQGHLPQKADEIVVTEDYLHDTGKSIGDTVSITEKEDQEDSLELDTSGWEDYEEDDFFSDGQEDTSSDPGEEEDTSEETEDSSLNFLVTDYTISGTVVDVFDINAAEGSVSSFRSTSTTDYTFYVSPEAVTYDVYTAVYLRLSGTEELLCYSGEYRQQVEEVISRINQDLKEVRQKARYDSVTGEASDRIRDAEEEMQDKFAEYDDKFAEAAAELSDGRETLEKSGQELTDGKQQIAEAKAQLQDGQAELDSGKKELEDGQAQLDSAKNTLAASQAQLSAGWEALEEAQKEIDENLAVVLDGEEQLADAEKQLEEGQTQLEEAQQQIDDSRAQLQEAETQLEEGQAELDSSREMVEAAGLLLDSLKEALDRADGDEISTDPAEIAESLKNPEKLALELKEGIEELQEQEPDQEELEALNTLLKALAEKLESYQGDGEALMEDIQSLASQLEEEGLTIDPDQLAALGTDRQAWIDFGRELVGEAEDLLDQANTAIEEGQQELEEGKKQIEDGLVQLEEGQAQIDASRKTLEENRRLLEEKAEELADGKEQLAQGQKTLDENRITLADAQTQLEEGQAQILASQKTLDENRALLEASQKKIDQGWEEIRTNEQELADGEKELADGWEELREGEQEYEDNLALYGEKKADALQLIADAWEEVRDLDMAQWYIQKRTSLDGYANVSSDSDSIDAIGAAFPFIFFIVAILISLTTVSRMVEEERGLIGTYKGLGYSNAAIRRKYELYAVLACLFGGAVGIFAGFVVLPLIIFIFFGMMYQLPEYVLRFSFWRGSIAVLLFVGGVWLTTVLTCNKALKEVPAELMRPKAPAKGSRILLERVTGLWKKLSFLNKVTARNLFRYKKRLFMTVAGIMGCTALLIVGFAIKDTVTSLVDKQYRQVAFYDLVLAAESEEKLEAVMERLDGDPGNIREYLQIGIRSVSLKTDANGDSEMTIQLFLIPDDCDLTDYLDLHDQSGNPLTLSDTGALITCNAADVLGFTAGDEVFLQDTDYASAQVEVDGVVLNYLGNYIFMKESTYGNLFGKEAAGNGLLINYTDACTDPNGYADLLAEEDGVLSAVSTQSLIDSFSQAFVLINLVVYVLLIMSAGLAFTVLFTLSTTNISERERELATIKVLGFYNNEVHLYVNKETMILTLIGIVAGIPLGNFLSGCLTWILKMPSLYFDVSIFPQSILYSAGLAFAFAMIVTLMTNRSVDEIDPITALKSVE